MLFSFSRGGSPKTKRTIPFPRIVGGAAVGALMAAAMLPVGRNLLVPQAALAVGSTRYIAPPLTPTEAVRRAEASPDNLSLQIGASVVLQEWSWRDLVDGHSPIGNRAESPENRRRFLLRQAARWQGYPDFDIVLLSLYLPRTVRLHRPELSGEGLTLRFNPSKRPKPEKPTARKTLDAFDAIARDGEIVDSANALFPLMRSLAALEGRRDGEAITLLERAAACPAWREPSEECTRAMRLLWQREHPGVAEPGIRRFADRFYGRHQFLWIDRALDDYAITMLALAVRLERGGDLAAGMRIRRAMIDCGAKMAWGSAESGSGERLCDTALLCPGGAPPTKNDGTWVWWSGHMSVFGEANYRPQRWAAWESYLRSRGLDDQADLDDALFRSQIAHDRVADDAGFGAGYLCESLLYLWESGVLLLDNVLWTLLLGGAAFLTVVAARRKGRKAAVGMTSVFTLLGAGLYYRELMALRFLGEGPMGGMLFEDRFHGIRLGWFAPMPLLVPLLLILAIAVLTLVRRRNDRGGFDPVRCAAGAAIPLAAVLILVYTLIVLPPTVRTERALAQHLRESR